MNTLSLLLVTSLQETKEGAPAPGGSSFLLPMILILGIFYVVLILPERKKQKQRQALLDGVKKGDPVMTTSGIYGTVAAIHDDKITLQIADSVRIKIARAAIQDVLNAQSEANDKKDEQGSAKEANKQTATT